jgi:hypothetical protein
VKSQEYKKCPLDLRYFYVKIVSSLFHDSYEDFNKAVGNTKQKTVDTLPKYKLDFAHLSAYSGDGANINFGKSHTIHKLLTKNSWAWWLTPSEAEIRRITD